MAVDQAQALRELVMKTGRSSGSSSAFGSPVVTAVPGMSGDFVTSSPVNDRNSSSASSTRDSNQGMLQELITRPDPKHSLPPERASAVNPNQQSGIRSGISGGTRTRAKFLAIASGKGGVGKSSIAVNLAIRLAKMGRRVVLLDADLGTANADVICNINPTCNLAHVIAGRRTLEQAMTEAPGGFQLIAGASGLAQVAALGESERARVLEGLRHLEQEMDLVIIDTAAGVSPNILTFALGADQLLVVTTPEPTAITDAYALIKTVHRQNNEVDVRLLVNMVRDAHEAKAVFDRVQAVCHRFLRLPVRYAGHIAQDPRVALAVRRRRPFILEHPHCEASLCINQLAHRVDRHASEPRGEGLLQRVASWWSR